MDHRPRPDLCGGRRVTGVPTATEGRNTLQSPVKFRLGGRFPDAFAAAGNAQVRQKTNDGSWVYGRFRGASESV